MPANVIAAVKDAIVRWARTARRGRHPRTRTRTPNEHEHA